MTTENGNPYPGLRPFRVDEEHLFFGREGQLDFMIERLARTHFLAVIGSSGSGKSSLVNCGLRPALHRGVMTSAGPAWRVVQFRPGGRPIEALARALTSDATLFPEADKQGMALQAAVQGTLRLSRLGISDVLRQARVPDDVNVLIVADQFEELFRYRSAGAGPGDGGEPTEDGRALVDLLLEATDQRQRLYVVITLRADFLGDCAEFGGLPEAINRGQYLVPRLTRDERRRAITLPAKVFGGRLSPNLITRLMNDADAQPDQLVLLQHALNRTWSAVAPVDGGRVLELQHYVDIGGVEGALDQHAESIFSRFGIVRKTICRKLFQALTDKVSDARGTRRPTAFGLLCEIIDLPAATVAPVIQAFREPGVGFLTPGEGELHADTVLDIAHESLMRLWRRLASWADEEAEAAAFLQTLCAAAERQRTGKQSLWREPELSNAERWLRTIRPNAAWAARYTTEFVSAQRFLRRSRWAQRARIAAVALMALGLVGLAVRQYLSDREHARTLQANADALKLALDDRQRALDGEKEAKDELELRLNQQVDTLEHQLELVTKDHPELGLEVQALRQRNRQLGWDVLEAREENLVLTDQIGEAKRRNANLELDALDAAEQNERMRAEQLALVKERDELVEQAKRLAIENADLTKAVKQLERDNERLSRRLLQAGYLIPDRGVSYGTGVANGLSERGGTQDMLIGPFEQSPIPGLKRRIAQLEERLRADLAETRRFELMADELTAENARLTAELEAAVSERTRLRAEMDALRAEGQKLQARIDELRAERQQLEKALTALRSARDAAAARLEPLERDHARLQDREQDLRSQNELLSEFVGIPPRKPLRDAADAGPPR